jgi:hypothetical protein
MHVPLQSLVIAAHEYAQTCLVPSQDGTLPFWAGQSLSLQHPSGAMHVPLHGFIVPPQVY